jgi:FkbM family methyltransferase
MIKIFKKAVKRGINAFGYDIHKKGSIRTSMSEVLDHLKKLGFRPETVIDVGVAFGTFELYNGFPDSTHLLIEPLKEFERVLRDISRKFKTHWVLAAANDTPGTIVINVHPVLFASSMFKESEGSHVDGVAREVPAVTIDNLCKEKNLRGPYLVKADVHGAELRVLDGAKKVLDETEIVILEVHLFQFFIDGPQFFDVVNYMKGHRFCVYDIFGHHYRPLDGALGSVDIVFVKGNGRFRESHIYATREQREKLTRSLRSLIETRLR